MVAEPVLDPKQFTLAEDTTDRVGPLVEFSVNERVRAHPFVSVMSTVFIPDDKLEAEDPDPPLGLQL